MVFAKYVVTKSQVVTKFNVTKPRLHRMYLALGKFPSDKGKTWVHLHNLERKGFHKIA